MRDHEAVFRERVARYQKKHGLRGFFSHCIQLSVPDFGMLPPESSVSIILSL